MANPKCIHCGEDCGKYPVMWDNKPFCCNGCKTVYQLLNENQLYTYYDLENTPGIKVETHDYENKYAYLDKDEIKEKLLDFSEGGISKITLYVPGIHCSSCIWLLENLHLLNPGIKQSVVNFVKKEVYITFKENEVTLRQIVELMASIHYIPLISLDSLEKKDDKKTNRQLLYKIGIAGFAFGNTMMYSLPEYLPGKEFIDQAFKNGFGWLNFLLALPVVFYSASDYWLSAAKNLRHKMVNIDLPISIGIIAIFLQSSYEIFTGIGSGYMDSLTGLVFFLLIGKWYQNKTYQALSFERDYKSYFPVAVTKIDANGTEDSILLENLRKGDHILIRNRELIPADATLTKGTANIDYSFVTGESAPVRKTTGEELFAGGRQIGSAIELEVQKEVEQSRLTKLWNQDHSKESNQDSLTTTIDRVSRYFTIAVLSIATITAIFWIFYDSSVAIFAFTSVLIVACPCALALSMPFAFGNTLRIFGRRGLYLKKTNVVEQLTKIDTVVFDKTGTITQPNAVKIEFNGLQLSKQERIKVKSVSRHSTHPMSTAIYDAIRDEEMVDVENFRELPARGVMAVAEGDTIKIGSEEFVTGQASGTPVSSSQVFVSVNGNVRGHFIVRNTYREGLEEVMNKLSQHFDIHLISGDNDAEKPYLLPLFKDEKRLHFNQTPHDKLAYIMQLHQQGRHVLMLGDGLNDAGALSESDVGISIADDIYHFSPACDAILEARRFKSITAYLRMSKASMSVVHASFVFSFLYNVIGLAFAVQGLLSPIIAAILMPVSSVSVVAFVTFATSFIAKRRGLR